MTYGDAVEQPRSILIIGGGVFGISTAHALLASPQYASTQIILLDAYLPPPFHADSVSLPDLEGQAAFPTASLDSSRIIRPDYANSAYAKLAAKAQKLWRQGWPFYDGDLEGTPTPADLHQPASSTNTSQDSNAQKPAVYFETGLVCTANLSGGNPHAREYVRKAQENVQSLQDDPSSSSAASVSENAQASVLPLKDTAAIAAAFYQDGQSGRDSTLRPAELASSSLGEIGYLNHTAGWAHASNGLSGARQRLVRLNGSRKVPMKWLHGKAEALHYVHSSSTPSEWKVAGAMLADGTRIEADMTILAAGAWCSTLLPRSLGRRIRAQGQPLAYVNLTDEEAKILAGIPVLLNLSSGTFVMSPPPFATWSSSARPVLKVAQHSHGYSHNVQISDTEPSLQKDTTNKDKKVEVSFPASSSPIPPRSQKDLRDCLAGVFPHFKDRPFAATRLCWYADTGSGDFLVDFVPRYGKSLLVATGGSGHGYKMLPVLGEWIVQRMEGRLGVEDSLDRAGGQGQRRDEGDSRETGLGRRLAHQWRWRTDEEIERDWIDPGDGSKGGEQGLVWADEMKRELDI